MLRALDATQTGRAVLNGIRFHKREVLIYPYYRVFGRATPAPTGA